MFNFENKVVMITGASGNLGNAVARAFRQSGARLALVARNRDLIEKAFPDLIDVPTRLFTNSADLTSPESTQALVDEILAQYGRLDILVHTVGGYRAGTPLHETPLDTLDFMLKLNATTTFNTNQAVIPHMIKQGGGKIVNIAARPGLAGRKNMAAYSASKAAVLRLTESASAEVKQHSININAILPGTIDTPSNRADMPNADHAKWVKPESLADVIQFLASDAARDVHGTAVPVYGLT
jgi:NAD(P)-dependent dehydrogenase (short-subunit alcohol dehydrogenase family)